MFIHENKIIKIQQSFKVSQSKILTSTFNQFFYFFNFHWLFYLFPIKVNKLQRFFTKITFKSYPLFICIIALTHLSKRPILNTNLFSVWSSSNLFKVHFAFSFSSIQYQFCLSFKVCLIRLLSQLNSVKNSC